MSELILLGDIGFGGILSTQPELNFERYSQILPFLNKPGAQVFANLEMPVKINHERNHYKKNIHYSLPVPTEELLQLFNIRCVSLANNHIYDCKMSGLRATITLLDKLGISHTGAGWKPEHCDPVILKSGHLKIGFLAYVDRSTNPKAEYFQELYLNYFDPEEVVKDIESLKHKVDVVLCSIHWGTDYSYYPTPDQVKIAKDLIASGVDIIMGHHPHTFQPFEKYKEGYIFYSLGSLTFGDYIREGKSELQALYRKTKKSAVVNYVYNENRIGFIPTKELKGNYILIDKRDYNKWSTRKWNHFRIKYSSPFAYRIYNFNEKVLYRIFEYFFGYYQNSFHRMFQFKNFRKISRLFK